MLVELNESMCICGDINSLGKSGSNDVIHLELGCDSDKELLISYSVG